MIVVGCPVHDRAWSMPSWFDHVNRACEVAGEEPRFVFVGDPATDPETFAAIDASGEPYDLIPFEGVEKPYKRVWNLERLSLMVGLRNALLGRVRDLEPSWFWSVDSDILVAENTLESALEATARFDAVGSRCYMTPAGTSAPSYAMFNNGGLLRHDSRGCHKADAIMAVKLMSPKAYSVDYVYHRQGEDIGWSIEAKKARVKLGWDGRTISKHMMSPEVLGKVDSRVGF